MKKLKIFFYLLFFCASTFAQINYELLEEIDAKVKTKYGNDVIVKNYFEIDSIAIRNFNYPIPDKVVDYNNVLSGKILFTAMKYNLSTATKGVVGIYENRSIVWDSDTTIICIDIDILYLYSTYDLNRDGNIDIVFSATELGIQAGTERLYIYSWNGNSGQLISNLDSDGLSEIVSLTGIGKFDFVDVNGDGIYEILGKWYLPDDDIDEKIVTYYWDGINYSFEPTNPQPQTIDFFPQNEIEVNVRAGAVKIDSLFSYNYKISNLASSIQEINGVYLEKFVDTLFTLNSPQYWDHFIYYDLVSFQDFHSPTLGYYNNFIRKNETESSFALSSFGLPSLAKYYIQGYNREPLDSTLTQRDYYENILSNSISNYTIGPKDLDTPFVPINFLDTLLNYNQRSIELGWTANQATADKYDTLFNTAKTLLEGNHIPWVDSTLHTVLEEVDEDSSGNITSEAYALLRYNTEYLLEHLPEVIPPVLNSISPAIVLRYISGGVPPLGLTVTVTGANFSDSSVAYFNGSAKTTTVVSDTVLTFPITGSEMSTLGNYFVWISTYGSNSDTLTFSVVDNLPQTLAPTLQCVHFNGGSSYTAYFGYNNDNSVSVYVPLGSKNKFSPSPIYRGQPNLFLPGSHISSFSLNFDGSNITWTLDQTSTNANKKSEPCP